jgi:Holliday junction resolvasome RuvABC endonuclease subunit
MGFDQSYTNSGYCIVDETGTVLDFGTFKSAKAMDVYERAIQVSNFIVAKVAEHKVNKVHLEGLAFGMRGDATRDLAGLLFTIVIALRTRTPVKPEIIAPTSLKKFATGTGKSDKAAMIAAVPPAVLETFTDANYKKTTGLADIVDAYWLATYKLKQSA